METDLLWQLFTSSKKPLWHKLCLLNVAIYDAPEFKKWAMMLRAYLWDEVKKVTKLKHGELVMWAYNDFRNTRLLDCMCKWKKYDVLDEILPQCSFTGKRTIFISCAKYGLLNYLKNSNMLLPKSVKLNALKWTAVNDHLETFKWIAKGSKITGQEIIKWCYDNLVFVAEFGFAMGGIPYE